MKYIVVVGYKKFLFDNAVEALDFAVKAKEHIVYDNDYERELDVSIELEEDEND